MFVQMECTVKVLYCDNDRERFVFKNQWKRVQKHLKSRTRVSRSHDLGHCFLMKKKMHMRIFLLVLASFRNVCFHFLISRGVKMSNTFYVKDRFTPKRRWFTILVKLNPAQFRNIIYSPHTGQRLSNHV